jgi:septal ring factor EnvC (AmiA/AmiB activator)
MPSTNGIIFSASAAASSAAIGVYSSSGVHVAVAAPQALEADLADLQQEVAELQNSQPALAAEKSRLHATISQHEQALQQAEADLQEARAELQACRSNMSRLEYEIQCRQGGRKLWGK